MRRTHRNVLVTAAILAALCLPAAAPAIEGAGAHKGMLYESTIWFAVFEVAPLSPALPARSRY